MNVAEQIIDSLENHLEEWEAEWWHKMLFGPWLAALYHPKGIKISWNHMEHTLAVIEVECDGKLESLSIYHKGEQQKVHDAFRKAEKRLQEEMDIELKEHDDKLRLRLKDKLSQL